MDKNKKNIEIYYYYLGEDIYPGKKYYSPFRNDKFYPALSFKFIGDTLTWKDFGGLELNKAVGKNRDGLGFIIQMENLNDRFAAEKFYLKNIKDQEVPDRVFKVEKKDRPEPLLEIRTDYYDFEWDWWKFIDRDLLKPEGIFPNHLYDSGFVKIQSQPGSPSFAYIFSRELNSWKLYTPKNPEHKFKSNNVRGVIEGYDTLPQSGEFLAITKATKDRLVYRTYLPYFSSLAPHSENAWNEIIKRKDELNDRFENIFICFDADPTGHKNTAKIHEQTGWTPIYKPLEWADRGMKDESDIVINYGKEELMTAFKYLKLCKK